MYLLLINVALVFVSFWVAERSPRYSLGWWLNMIASATNAAVVVLLLTKPAPMG